MTAPLWTLDATEQARLIRLGQASSREVTRAVLDRLHAVNPGLNAVVDIMEAEALEAARIADAARMRGGRLGPLHGVPVTVKINTDCAGRASTNGVAAFKDAIAKEDAPVIANLRDAGAVIVGRTNTPAFSMRVMTTNDLHGRTINPLDPAITPGGSSGGAGVAVATGIGAIAHGNDIAGSVRIPAYCCGVIGLRVGLGRIPSFSPGAAAPIAITAQLMSVQGALSRTLRDARLAYEVMARGDPRDARWVEAPLFGPKPPRAAALMPDPPGGWTHPAQAEAVRQAGRFLEAAGYLVEEVTPPDVEAVIDIWHTLGSTDLFASLRPRIDALGDEASRISVAHWLDLHPPSDLDGVLKALALRDLIIRRWQTFFMRHGVLVLPTLADLPPRQDEDLTLEGQRRVLNSLRACLIAPALGLAGLQIPVGRHGALRPGVQIMAARFREDLCLDAGEVIEAAQPPIQPLDPCR